MSGVLLCVYVSLRVECLVPDGVQGVVDDPGLVLLIQGFDFGVADSQLCERLGKTIRALGLQVDGLNNYKL